MARVLVAMSGGLDSTMAAALLCEDGHDVTGVHLKMANTPSGLPGKGCCTLDDARDARRVSDKLGIPFYVWDFAEAFTERVVDDFVIEYAKGRTPNPCIRCNERVKYAALLERAVDAGFEYLATGHHVRLEGDDVVTMHRPKDSAKDQTYVLYMATQTQLRHTLFPVGTYPKSELRKMAAERGLVTAHKPDSTDICFIPSGDTGGFLENKLGVIPGPIVDDSGAEIGRHDGAFRFTIGQRRGLGISGQKEPVFVTGIADNVVTIGRRRDLAVDRLTATKINWIAGEPPTEAGLTARVRYHGERFPVTISDATSTAVTVTFTAGQPIGVAPGQAVVMYREDQCLGGGTIVDTHAAA